MIKKILSLSILILLLSANSFAKDKKTSYSHQLYNITLPQKWKFVKRQENKLLAIYGPEFGKVSLNLIISDLNLPKDSGVLTEKAFDEALDIVQNQVLQPKAKGVRRVNKQKAYWVISHNVVNNDTVPLNLASYTVITYNANKIFTITCSTADITEDKAFAKLDKFRPQFLEIIDSIRFKRTSDQIKRFIIKIAIYIVLFLLAFMLRFKASKFINSPVKTVITAVILWLAVYPAFYFLLRESINLLKFSFMLILFILILWPLNKDIKNA